MQKQDLPHARIVFDVALEGKARKSVTVRSALLIVNKLPENLEIKLESQLPHEAGNNNMSIIILINKIFA